MLAHGLDSWMKRGLIDKIRLDLVDQFPGLIEIKSIAWKKAGDSAAASRPLVWNAANGFEGWGLPVRCEMKQQADALRLTLTGKDSSIVHRQVSIDPKAYNRLDIVYKASGLPRQTTGQLFFADLSAERLCLPTCL